MKRRALMQRCDRLDGGLVPTLGRVWIRLELGPCATQAQYDRAFAQAWAHVPPGAAVFCFPELSEKNWLAHSARHREGLPFLMGHRCGIYLKLGSGVAE